MREDGDTQIFRVETRVKEGENQFPGSKKKKDLMHQGKEGTRREGVREGEISCRSGGGVDLTSKFI